MAKSDIRVSKFYEAEEAILQAKLDAARAVVSHAGEKGRTLEVVVAEFLRSFLPDEYGISTGFFLSELDGAITASPQLDILIYDAIRGGPIARLGACDVFPLESVIAYVEVKTSVLLSNTSDYSVPSPTNSIVSILQTNKKIRDISRGTRFRKYFRQFKTRDKDTGRFKGRQRGTTLTGVAVRGYVVAFEIQNRNPTDAEKNIRDLAENVMRHSRAIENSHIHGVFVPQQGYIQTLTNRNYQTRFTIDHPLSNFKWKLLQGLSTVKRTPLNWIADIERYGRLSSSWDYAVLDSEN